MPRPMCSNRTCIYLCNNGLKYVHTRMRSVQMWCCMCVCVWSKQASERVHVWAWACLLCVQFVGNDNVYILSSYVLMCVRWSEYISGLVQWIWELVTADIGYIRVAQKLLHGSIQFCAEKRNRKPCYVWNYVLDARIIRRAAHFGRIMGRQMVTPRNTMPKNLSAGDALSLLAGVFRCDTGPDIYSSIIRPL